MIETEEIKGKKSGRKPYIDNIRWATVLLVIVYHVIYIFNSAGVISNIGVTGIKQMDILLYFVYPWFMPLLFVISGISARYFLESASNKKFVKERVKRLLIPSVAGIFILGWVSGWVTNQYVNMFAQNGDAIPGIIKYFILCMCGIGPLWFAHELFLASMVLVLLRAIDKKERGWKLGGKVNVPVLLLLVFAVWGSSWILNTPLIEVYRNGIYIFLFLLGYYVFSHEKITDLLVKYRILLLIAALVTGAAYTVYYYGTNYTLQSCLGSLFTNFYLWIMILAIIGCFKAWCDRESTFSKYMSQRNFGFYILHYPLMVFIGYLTVTYLRVPMLYKYFIILIMEIILLPVLYEIVNAVPILRFLLLGRTKKQRKETTEVKKKIEEKKE